MVKRCAWVTCNPDSRYPGRLQNGVYFIPFPKPHRDKKKCRPNVDQIVRIARIPTEFKLVTFCMYFKVFNIPLHISQSAFRLIMEEIKSFSAQNFSKTCFDILTCLSKRRITYFFKCSLLQCLSDRRITYFLSVAYFN